jgi:glycosyltransferase involved in cell wall biosynthesis
VAVNPSFARAYSHIECMKKVGIFTTHPIQYQAPVWRQLAASGRFSVKVFFFSDHGVTNRMDSGFGETFAWDLPLLEGYEHEFLSRVPISQVAAATIPGLPRLLERERFDVVMVHGYAAAYTRQLLRRRRPGGYRYVMRGEFATLNDPSSATWRSIVKRPYLSRLYRHVDLFSAIGRDSTAHLLQHGVPGDKIVVAPYCVDDALIEVQRDSCGRAEARRRLGIEDGTTLILFSGKLIARKQPLLLADAISRLPNVQRVAACFLGAGEQRDAIEATLRPILGPRLLMPGFVNQSQLGGYFAAADVFSLPTAYDTWGLVVNEAMHWGLACVVSDQAGCHKDLIIDGQTGVLHRWNDPVGLAACLDRLIREPGMIAAMGTRARRHADGYRSAVTTERLLESFERVSP